MDIHIYNLSLNIIDADLRKLFSPYGVVNSAEVIRDKYSGRSQGNGRIQMPVGAEALQAITSLNQTMMDGKKISVAQIEDRLY